MGIPLRRRMSADKICTKWTYASAADEPNNVTADCTTVGFGCSNPAKNDGTEKCLCKATDGMKTKDDGSCYCDVGYYQVTG